MLSWERGLFELTPEDPRKFEAPIDLNVQEVLMEGFRQKDELAQLKPKLPASGALRPASPLVPKLTKLNPEQLDTFQAMLNSSSIDNFFDQSPFEDLKTAQVLVDLIQQGYVES